MRVFVTFRDAERFVSDGGGYVPASSVFVFRPKARTALTESLDRFWDSLEIFSPNVFRGPVKIRDKLSLKIRDKRVSHLSLSLLL